MTSPHAKEPPLNRGYKSMEIRSYAQWAGRLAFVLALVVAGWGLSSIVRQPVTSWFAASATIGIVALLTIGILAATWLLCCYRSGGALYGGRFSLVQYFKSASANQHDRLER